MSNKENESNKLTSVIKEDALFSIDVSAGFYLAMKNAITLFVKDKNPEEIKSALEMIKSDKVTEDWVRIYHSLIVFCAACEKKVIETKQYEELTEEQIKERFGEDSLN